MGCFNVAGSISRNTIGHGDKVVFFILAPGRYEQFHKRKGTDAFVGVTNARSNEGTCFRFQPRFLPIRGEYNDYGSLENIEEDANVQFIKEYYGIDDIGEFIDAFTRMEYDGLDLDIDERKLEELKKCGGMFEHQSVFDGLVSWQRTQNVIFKAWVRSNLLIEAGFEQITSNDGKSSILTHPDYPQVSINVSDWSVRDVIINGEKQSDVYYMNNLAERIGFKQDLIDELSSKTTDMLNIENVLKSLDDVEELEDKLEELRANLSTDPDNEALKDAYMDMRVMMRLNMRMTSNVDGPLEFVYESKNAEKIEEMLLFDQAMFSTNNMYLPAMSGEQHGNADASKVLNRLVAEQLEAADRKWDD